MKCKACGKEITEGYMIQDYLIGSEYYCNDTCLEKNYSKEIIELMKEEPSEEKIVLDCFYTVFEEEENYCFNCTSYEEEGFYCNELNLYLKENCKACLCFNKKDWKRGQGMKRTEVMDYYYRTNKAAYKQLISNYTKFALAILEKELKK